MCQVQAEGVNSRGRSGFAWAQKWVLDVRSDRPYMVLCIAIAIRQTAFD